jgi:anti-sigma regulatory factor (Ser/Thr protein kinase)
MRIPQYLTEIASGIIAPAAEPEFTQSGASRLKVDGRRGFGQVVGMKMVDALIPLARSTGIAMANGRHLGHTGRIGAYPEALAKAGLVGMAVCNGAPSGHWVAAFGGRDGRISRPAEPVEASCLRRLASRWAAQHEVLAPRHDDIVLAVGEATANSALHAYRDGAGEIRLECAIDAAHATFRVRDWGAWLPPSAQRDSRGILLMERLADSFELRHLADGTEVILRFDIGTPVRA